MQTKIGLHWLMVRQGAMGKQISRSGKAEDPCYTVQKHLGKHINLEDRSNACRLRKGSDWKKPKYSAAFRKMLLQKMSLGKN